MLCAKLLKQAGAAGLLVILCVTGGCGYTMKGTLPEHIKTIAIPTFKNDIAQSNRYTYEPGLEIDVTNAVIDRVLYDGSLKVVDADEADVILIGSIVRYEQEIVRYNSTEGVREYRLFLVTKLMLKDRVNDTVLWTESHFSGDTDYFVEGARAISEHQAADEAIEDLAKRIVDRIVEDW